MIIAGIYNYQEHEKWNSIPCGYQIKQFYVLFTAYFPYFPVEDLRITYFAYG